MKIKKFGIFILAFAFLTAIAAYGGGSQAAGASASGTEKPFAIRVGADAGAFSYQFRVAKKAGIFDKHNVSAEVYTFSYGIDTVNAAILGETDSAEAMDFAAASRFSESNKLRILATITTALPTGSHLYTRDDVIKTPADLKGKRIGVQKGTVNEYQWARLFEKYNLKKDEVTHVYLSSNAELLAAYQANELDALWVGAEIENAVNQIPSSRILGDQSLHGHLSRGFLLLDADVIARNPAGVERFLKALDEATVFIREKPEETARIAYEDLKIPVDSALKAIKAQNYELRLTQEDLDLITGVANWSYENGIFRNKYDIKDYIDPGPLRNVLPDRVTIQ
jgi:NitT/TauT family transport system substrate-binding protein